METAGQGGGRRQEGKGEADSTGAEAPGHYPSPSRIVTLSESRGATCGFDRRRGPGTRKNLASALPGRKQDRPTSEAPHPSKPMARCLPRRLGPCSPHPPPPPLPKPALPAAELAGRALHCELNPAPLSKAAAAAAAAAAGITPSQSTLSEWLCFDTIRDVYPSPSESLWRVACGRGVTFPTRVGRIEDSDNQSFSTTDARTRTHARTRARAHTHTQARGKIKVPQAGKRLRICWHVRFFAPSP